RVAQRREGDLMSQFAVNEVDIENVLDIPLQTAMMCLATEEEKNAARHAQVGFPGQSILTASRRRNPLRRLASTAPGASSRTWNDATRDAEIEFSAGSCTGKDTSREAEPNCAGARIGKSTTSQPGPANCVSVPRCGRDQDYTSEAPRKAH